MGAEPGVGLFQGGAEVGRGLPAQGGQFRRIEYFARHTVRPARVENDAAAIADDFGDELGRFHNGYFRSAAQVNGFLAFIAPHGENTGVSQIANVKEFAQRPTRPPYRDRLVISPLGLVHPAHQGGNDVATFGLKSSNGPKELAGTAVMKGAPCCRRYAWHSFQPASLATA